MSKVIDCDVDVESWNPTAVTHSCSGNFTGPDDRNLIVAKSNLIEIHLVTPGIECDLKYICNVPIKEGIGILEVFRPSYEPADLLFIATKTYKYHVLQWDATAKEIIKRVTGDVTHPTAKPYKHDGFRPTPGEICTVDVEQGLIGLYMYDDLFTLVRFNNQGQFEEPFFIRLGLQAYRIFDVKFVYGFKKPTICVICQSTIHKAEEGEPHAKVFEVKLNELCCKEHPFPIRTAGEWPNLLIQVPPPRGGVLIIGKDQVVYVDRTVTHSESLGFSFKRAHERNLFGDRRQMLHLFGIAHGRIDASTYLIGDHSGGLYLLEMIYSMRNIILNHINVQLVGETSIASTISCIEKDLVYVGSRYGDSQLIRFHPRTRHPEVLKRYINLDPVADFCVTDLEKQGQGLVLTCSGGYKNGSVRIVRNETRLCLEAHLELEGIKGMWSIKSTADDVYDKLLVVSLISETRIFAMRKVDEPEYMLEEITIEGFCCDKQTLFCHTTAVDNQVVQVTLSSVRLVSLTLGKLLCEWHADNCINVATANATQVLVATAGRELAYLEIGDGNLFGEKRINLKQDISCLDLNSVGENANRSDLAAVGTWMRISVKLFSLPDLNLITEEYLDSETSETVPRSVLFCLFEEAPYLFCGLGNGQVFSFLLKTNTMPLHLTNKKEVSFGTEPIELKKFSIKNTTNIFVGSDRPAVINSSLKKILYGWVNINEARHMCAFKSAEFPDSLAIAIGPELTIWTIEDIPKLHIQSIYINEEAQCIAHQKQSHTFCICSVKSAESSESSFVHLLDDQTFAFVSKYPLGQKQYGCCILNCSLTDANQDYYCVGTSNVKKEAQGQAHILIFKVECRELKLVAQLPLGKADSSVLSLNSFEGKLLAVIGDEIRLFKGELVDDGMRLKQEFSLYVQGLGKKLESRNFFDGISSLFEFGTNITEDISKNIPVEEFKKNVECCEL